MKILVTGISGRMGQAVKQAVELNPATEMGSTHDVGQDIAAAMQQADIAIDFSFHGFTPELLATAMRRRVLLLSPANLMMALHLARLLWQRDTQQKNVQTIVERATLLYEKFALFRESFDAVQKALESATSACEEARSRLYSGKGNYHSQVEKLRELGIK